MTLEEVKKFIEENKDNAEVKKYLQGLNPISVEGINDFVKTDEGKKWLDSEKDKHHNKALETWKSNNLQKLVDEKVKELYPEETPEQKKIRELEAKINEAEKQRQKESLKNLALTSVDGKIPKDLVDFLLADDEETTKANIEKVAGVFESHVTTKVEERLKAGGRTIPKPNSDDDVKNPFSKEHFNLTEQTRLWKENPELAKTLQASSK